MDNGVGTTDVLGPRALDRQARAARAKRSGRGAAARRRVRAGEVVDAADGAVRCEQRAAQTRAMNPSPSVTSTRDMS